MLSRIIQKHLRHSPKQRLSVLFPQTNANFSNSLRFASNTPINTVIMFVPQQEAWAVERMGKFHRMLQPGLNFLIPVLDKVKYVQCLKEIVLEISERTAVTSDSVAIKVDGILFLRVNDAYLASYNIEDPEFAVTQLAHTSVRSELGKLSLDDILRQKENFSLTVIKSINETCGQWGITCIRYEIKNIDLPEEIREAMKLQAEAERKSRAAIIEAEGQKAAEIRIAEGKKAAKIIESETALLEMMNRANGEASVICTIAEARAKSIEIIANALEYKGGINAAALSIAEQYVSALDKMAKTNNTLIVSQNASDISQNIVQALTMYKKISKIQNIEEA